MSSDITMGSAGTPQGSVISPMLFNLALLGLPSHLQAIPGLDHTIYADNVTLWVCGGSDGSIEQRLQEAIDTVERYLRGTGLSCSAEKSELLLYRPTLKGRPPKHYQAQTHVDVTTSDGRIIPTMDKILGLLIEGKGANGETVRRLTPRYQTRCASLNEHPPHPILCTQPDHLCGGLSPMDRRRKVNTR